MKRNEKFLVYAVTGFLVVILVVAVVFGNEDFDPRPAEEDPVASGPAVSLEDILKGKGSPEQVLGGEEKSPEGGDPGPEGPGTDGPGAGEGPPSVESGDDPQPEPDPTVGEIPLVVPTPADEVRVLFGPSRRERDFRVVEVRSGDSLRALVQRWCGSLDFLGRVERLNETAGTLQPGENLYLPWIDDEEILAANKQRQERPETPAPVAVEAAGARLYEVKPDESVWKIAVREVGTRQAPGYIESIKGLNPEIENFDMLQVGQKIRLPEKQ